MYTSREQAERDVEHMVGWSNPRVIVEPEPDIAGYRIIYILAEDPETGITMYWGDPAQHVAKRLGTL